MGAIVFMPLSSGGVTVVDYADWQQSLNGTSWYKKPRATSKTDYAMGYPDGGRVPCLLHRYILNAPRGVQVDRNKYLGLFVNKADAANAYNAAVQLAHGVFAFQNGEK